MTELPQSSYTMTPLPDFVFVGKYCSIGSGVRFHSLNMEHQYTVNKKVVYTTNWDQPQETGKIQIFNDVWIANDVRILPNVQIGNGAIIGAGAVVTRNVPDYAVVVGNTGRIVKYRFPQDTINKLCAISWWDWEPSVIEARKNDMKDVDIFLQKYG